MKARQNDIGDLPPVVDRIWQYQADRRALGTLLHRQFVLESDVIPQMGFSGWTPVIGDNESVEKLEAVLVRSYLAASFSASCASLSCLRIGMFCGHLFSHAPQSLQAVASRPPSSHGLRGMKS